MGEDGEPIVTEQSDGSKAVSMGSHVASGAAIGSSFGPWGTVIGAGAGLVGGLLSNQSNREQADRGYASQREALQNSISWRVADAKRAGIHPLYALGAPAMNMSPVVMEDQLGPSLARAGQQVADTIRSAPTPEQRAQMIMDYRMASSQVSRNDAEADYYNALAAGQHIKNNETINAPRGTGLGVQPELQSMEQMPTGGGRGMVDLKAAENISPKGGAEWSAAGVNPNMELRYVDKKLPMYLPLAQGDSMEETLSEMSFPAYAGLLMRNQRIFGPGWMRDFIRSRYLGMEPEGVYDPRAKRKNAK